MKVLYFVPNFSLNTETFIYSLIEAMQREVESVRVMTLNRRNAESRPFSPVDLHPVVRRPWCHWLGAKVPVFFPVISRLPDLRGHSAHQELVSYLKSIRPDVVHAQFGSGGVMIADGCAVAGIPLVVSLRGYDASRYVAKQRWRVAYRWLFRKAAAVVIVSDEMRARVSELVPEEVPVYTIHAGKDIDRYAPRSRMLPVNKFLSVGRLVEKKGFEDAIRAIAYARQAGADVSLEIVGEGPLRQALEGVIRREGVGQHVAIRGEVGHGEVVARMMDAGGFILASRTAVDGDSEGVPNVLKEAQLIGVPLVSTKHGGIPSVVPTTNHHWLVEEGDWRMLGRRIVELNGLQPAELERIIQCGREHVIKWFSLTNEVTQHIGLYEQLTASLLQK